MHLCTIVTSSVYKFMNECAQLININIYGLLEYRNCSHSACTRAADIVKDSLFNKAWNYVIEYYM